MTFPHEAGLRDARRVTLRPFRPDDADDLYALFQSVPDSVRRNAWDRIDRRDVVNSWAREIDHESVSSILALDGRRVVGDATLHYRAHGPLRHVGRVKWLVHPDYEESGLGQVFVNTLVQMARDNGLKHVTRMLIAGLEDQAVATLRALAFEQYVIPGYGTDAEGNTRDMIKMVLRI